MARVSVITPTFRHAAFVGDCVRSVLSQSEPDWEMIVVDDGSDDGTADIASSFGDDRITVVRREHRGIFGLGAAYACAVARATSPLIAVLEGDDTWPAHKLEAQLAAFDDPAVVLAYGAAGLIDEHGHEYGTYRYAPRGRVAANEPIGSILPALVRVNFIVAPTAMVRRAALDRIGGFFQPPGIPYVDHPTWLRLARVGTFARSTRVLGSWRRHSRQVTTRAWFDPLPDREPYLDLVAAEADGLVEARFVAAARAASGRDTARQREEARLAHGRIALLERDWRGAASLFAPLVRAGEPRTRAVAGIGLLCAGGRIDMERLIGAAGRHALPRPNPAVR